MKVSSTSCGGVKSGKTVFLREARCFAIPSGVWIDCGKWKVQERERIADVEKLIE